MQRNAEAVLALQHQAMKSGGVDAGNGVARRKLACGDVGRGIDRELQRDRQPGQIDLVALQYHLVPGGGAHHLARDIFLTALAKCHRQVGRLDPQTGGQELAIAGHIGDQRHGLAFDVLEDDDGAAPRARSSSNSMAVDSNLGSTSCRIRRNSSGVFGFDHAQKSAQALIVDVRGPCHVVSNAVDLPSDFIVAVDCKSRLGPTITLSRSPVGGLARYDYLLRAAYSNGEGGRASSRRGALVVLASLRRAQPLYANPDQTAARRGRPVRPFVPAATLTMFILVERQSLN